MRSLWFLAVLAAACGGDDGLVPLDAAPDSSDFVLSKLQGLPGVTVTEQTPVNAPAGARYFVLQVQQPVDHDEPAGPRFAQEVSLVHISFAAPMVMSTTGYSDYEHDALSEPAAILGANQISIEHRFFGTSRPSPVDWSLLSIQQQAADQHAIVTLLKPLYTEPWVSTGASKGGMTAVFHRRFYPLDVAGTVAYVAPLSFAIPDHRYDPFLDSVGTVACRDAVRALATEMLQNRRPALLAAAEAQAAMGYAYTRIPLGPALESAVRDFEWTYWQYYGIDECPNVPAVTADDATIFHYLDAISPVTFSADGETAAFEAYFYQAYAQLGSPGLASVRGDAAPAYLAPFVQYAEPDYAGTLPVGVDAPAFDPAPMADIDNWVQHQATDLVFVYGQWDPWSGGAFTLGGAHDSLEVTVAEGTHGADIQSLALADCLAIVTKLQHWKGTGATVNNPCPAAAAAPSDNVRNAARARALWARAAMHGRIP